MGFLLENESKVEDVISYLEREGENICLKVRKPDDRLNEGCYVIVITPRGLPLETCLEEGLSFPIDTRVSIVIKEE